MRILKFFGKLFFRMVIFWAIVGTSAIIYFKSVTDGTSKAYFEDGSYYHIKPPANWCAQDNTIPSYIAFKLAEKQSPSVKGLRILFKGECGLFTVKKPENGMEAQITIMAKQENANMLCPGNDTAPIQAPGGQVTYCRLQVAEMPSKEAVAFVYPVAVDKSLFVLIDLKQFAANGNEIMELLKSSFIYKPE